MTPPDSGDADPLAAALDPGELTGLTPHGPSGLTHVPLPPDGLPLSSVDAALKAIKDALPIEGDADQVDEVIALLGTGSLPSLDELDGLVLTSLAFGSRGGFHVALEWPSADWELAAGFSIGGPALSIQVLPGANEVTVAGWLAFGGLALDAEVFAASDRLEVSAMLDHATSIGGLLSEVGLDGSSLDDLELTAAELAIVVADGEADVHAALAVGGIWAPFGDGPELHGLSMVVDYAAGAVTGEVAGTLGIGDFELEAHAAYNGLGWQLGASLAPEEGADPPSLENIVRALTDRLGVSVPDLPFDCELDGLGVEADTETEHFELWCDATIGDGDGDGDSGAQVTLLLTVDRDDDGHRLIRISGSLTVEGLHFDLVYDTGRFVFCFADQGGAEVDLGKVVEQLAELAGADEPPDLPEVDLTVREILIAALPAETEGAGSESEGVGGDGDDSGDDGSEPKRRTLLAVDVEVGLDVGQLPLVGDIFGSGHELEVRLAATYAGNPLTGDDVTSINEVLPGGATPVPIPEHAGEGAAVIDAGPACSLEVVIGDLVLPVPGNLLVNGDTGQVEKTASDGQPQSAPSTGRPESRPRRSRPPSNPRAGDDSKSWVDLDLTLGPLALSRLGIGLDQGDDPVVAVVLDGGVAFGPVTAAAMGLGVEYDLTSKHISPTLDGLAIAYESPGLSIAGGFLRTHPPVADPPVDMGDCYAGLIRVLADELQISALGLYQEAFGGPTFFIYGYAGFSVGLRPIVTVDGVALGFGYGRELLPVPATEIEQFPLVEEAMAAQADDAAGQTESGDEGADDGDGSGEGDDAGSDDGGSSAAQQVLDELAALQHYLPARRGGLVFAVGVKAGLFEGLIDGFVLLTVSLSLDDPGDPLIQVFGAGTAVLPPKEPSGPHVARLEIDIVARLRPAEGEMVVAMELGPGSYVLDPNAALTGGLAFGVWLHGEHEGDFVLTAGGYRADFHRPAHYPAPRRLGLHWHVSDELQVKGELYGAVVPHTFMAGGKLEADFNAGKVSAQFKLWMDVLIQWKPFHYDFTAGVEIDASYGSLGISASAEIHVWGPEFGGHAEVDAHVALVHVSFDVDFGSELDPPPAMAWRTFKESFLGPTDHAITIAATAGIHDTFEGKRLGELTAGSDGKAYLLCAQDMALVVTCAMPWGELDVVPMAHDGHTTRLTVEEPALTLARHDGGGWTNVQHLEQHLRPSDRTKRFPTALYHRDDRAGSTITLPNSVELHPKAPRPGTSNEIPHGRLDWTHYDVHATIRTARPGWIPVAVDDDMDDAWWWRNVLDDADVAEKRHATLVSLGVDTAGHAIRTGPGLADLTDVPRLRRSSR